MAITSPMQTRDIINAELTKNETAIRRTPPIIGVKELCLFP